MQTAPTRSTGQPPTADPGETGPLDLVDFMAARISDSASAASVLERVRRFEAVDGVERRVRLPSVYLSLEHHLVEADPQPQSREGLRAEVRSGFGPLLEDRHFALIFEAEPRQEVLLCLLFLRPMLSQVLETLGERADPSLPAVARWLDRLDAERGGCSQIGATTELDTDPVHEVEPAMLGMASEPSYVAVGSDLPAKPQEGSLSMALARLGQDLYEQLGKCLGEEQIRSIYEGHYERVANDFARLDAFAAIPRLFPPAALDERKLAFLSGSQTRRLLLEKLGELRSTHHQLEESYAEQQMALEVLERHSEELERHSEELEQRVAEQTSELRLTNETLQASEEQLRRISDSARDGIFMVDHRGRTSYVNNAAEAMLGYRRQELLGAPLLPLVVPERFRRRFRTAFGASLSAGDGPAAGRTEEIVARHKDGRELQVELSISTVKLHDRWHLVGVVRDISQRKRAEAQRRRLEEQLQETQRLESLGVLTGGIAHDFNNLLTTILGHVGLMEQLSPPEYPFFDSLAEVRGAAQRAAELTSQMLAYSGRGHFLVEAVDLPSLVDEIDELLRTSVSKRSRLSFDFQPGLPPVQADRSQLQQLLVNLVTNASDALGEDDGEVEVIARRVVPDRARLEGAIPLGKLAKSEAEDLRMVTAEMPAVELEVRDTGCGMPDEVRTKIFEPFFSTKFTGRGLGLAAVLGIVRGHRGAIEVETAPGRGTSVRVLLPLGIAAPGAPELPSTTVSVEGKKVLVVDDEPGVRFLVQQVLEAAGCQVYEAADGREGVRRYRQHAGELDLTILDLTMPNMDGEQALKALRSLDPEARVLLSSGYSRSETMERFSGVTVAGFLAKPYDSEELLAEVRSALSMPRKPRIPEAE